MNARIHRCHILLVVIAITMLTAVLHAQSREMMLDSLPRCYDLSFGSWKIGSETLDLYQPLPVRIALTSKVFWQSNGRTEYWGIRWPTDSLRRVATWQVDGQDSLGIRLPSWWSTGLWLAVRRRGRDLIGQAEVYADYLPMDPTIADVTATGVACPKLPAIK